MLKASNQKILIVNTEGEIKVYIYENKQIKLQSEKTLKSTKKVESWSINRFSRDDICLINDKEIVIRYMAAGFLSYNSFIGFFDIENDKEIQSFKYSVDSFAKINGNLLIFTVKNKLYPVYLENHAKKRICFRKKCKENYFNYSFEQRTIYS